MPVQLFPPAPNQSTGDDFSDYLDMFGLEDNTMSSFTDPTQDAVLLHDHLSSQTTMSYCHSCLCSQNILVFSAEKRLLNHLIFLGFTLNRI